MKKNKIILVVLALGLFAIIGYFFGDTSFAYGGYERSMVKFSSGAFNAIQEAYKTESKAYNTNADEIKKSLSFTEEVAGYVDLNDVPEEFRDKLTAEDKPYLAADGYKVTLVIKSKKYNRTSLWTFDNAETFKKIYPSGDN